MGLQPIRKGNMNETKNIQTGVDGVTMKLEKLCQISKKVLLMLRFTEQQQA